ncbi:MAG: hypothetical protein O3B86_06700 [Planctomycetota bacterium]|nr:hypothetical protein [Planctomycetota bacterium]
MTVPQFLVPHSRCSREKLAKAENVQRDAPTVGSPIVTDYLADESVQGL